MTTFRLRQNLAGHWDVHAEPNRLDAPPVGTFPSRAEALASVLDLADIRTSQVTVIIEFDRPCKWDFDHKGFFSVPGVE